MTTATWVLLGVGAWFVLTALGVFVGYRVAKALERRRNRSPPSPPDLTY